MTYSERARRADFPAAVYDLAVRLGVEPDDDRSLVTLRQTGRMKRSLDSTSWMAFTATQTISAKTCEFDWRARFGPFGMISAWDAIEGSEGRLDIAALGFIPIARTPHTTALLRGELMRYLAEIAWAPAAVLMNPRLRWRVEAPDRLAVGTGRGDCAVEVVLALDGDGRVAGAFAPDRPRSAVAPHLPTPWRGRFSDYRRQGRLWLPFAGEVAWEIDGAAQVYWQGRLVDWQTGYETTAAPRPAPPGSNR